VNLIAASGTSAHASPKELLCGSVPVLVLLHAWRQIESLDAVWVRLVRCWWLLGSRC